MTRFGSNVTLDATPSADTDVANCKFVKDAIASSKENVIDCTSMFVKSDNVKSMFTTSFMKIGNIVFVCINMTINKYTGSSRIPLGTLPEELRPVHNQTINTLTNDGTPCYLYIDSNGSIGCQKMKNVTWNDNEGIRASMVYLTKENKTK